MHGPSQHRRLLIFIHLKCFALLFYFRLYSFVKSKVTSMKVKTFYMFILIEITFFCMIWYLDATQASTVCPTYSSALEIMFGG
jgi:hypothetical protein